MNCQDCVHYVVCWRVKEVETGNPMISSYHICRAFKDESRYIELPCNVGDVVYYLHTLCCIEKGHFTKIETLKVTEIVYLSNREERQFCIKCGGDYFFDNCNFGETVFLTREEAEKALKESERK